MKQMFKRHGRLKVAILLTGGSSLGANIFKTPHFRQPLFEGNFTHDNTGISDESQIAVV